jgi:hypothetical protein
LYGASPPRSSLREAEREDLGNLETRGEHMDVDQEEWEDECLDKLLERATGG